MVQSLPIIIAVVSTAVQAASTLSQGAQAKQEKFYEANQLNQQAGQARATAQRQAIEQQRAGAYAASRGQAVSAASGASPTGPSTVTALQNIEGQAEYNRLSALFTGEERASGMEQGAATSIYQGKQAQSASYWKAAGTLAKGGETLYSKYGWDQPSSPAVIPSGVSYDPNLPWISPGNVANPYTNYG